MGARKKFTDNRRGSKGLGAVIFEFFDEHLVTTNETTPTKMTAKRERGDGYRRMAYLHNR